MITVIQYPHDYSFTGNPVVFEVSSDSNEPVNVEISIAEKTYSTTYYPFKISENSYRISMNLSDFLHFDNQIEFSGNQIISAVSGFALPYQVKIGSSYTFSGFALQGGISDQALRTLEENGYNIFTYRLSSPFEQFLFTTRTNGKEIRIKETELYPFVFRHPGVPILFRSESGDEVTTPGEAAGTFSAMNIRAVLSQMPEGTRRIDVCPSGEYAFHFTILPRQLSEERYLLRFRNSLGAFEMLEVTGKAMHTPEFSEENLWQTLTDFNCYEERRSRVRSKGVIEVETGYKDWGEFPFILDLLQSDEIYFLYPDSDSFRCHVKADSARFRQLMTEPTSIGLKIRMLADEEFATPKIEISESEEVSLLLSKHTIRFNENEGTENIEVVIHGTQNRSYSILNTPSWLKITNRTAAGFTVSIEENPTENLRSIDLTVRLDAYPAVQAILSVSQEGAWLSQFVFDVVTTVPNEPVARIVNLGAIAFGEAQFNYGDGTAIEIKPVPQSTEIHTVDGNGNSITILVGEDFGHLFSTVGTHTVTIQVRQGVNAFRFSTVPEGSVGDWGAEFVQNDYIRAIRKVKSDSLTSGYKMFAGCRRASFAPQWDGLETPNMTDFGFMFENFGSYGSGSSGAFTVNDRLRFPANTYQFISNTSKSQIHGLTRTYFGSGFEKIEKSMLSCAADGALTSLFETFRGMGNVGANWTAKYGNPDSQGRHIIDFGNPQGNNLKLEEFVETDLIWNQHNICNFTGAFNAINDYYGLYDSGYSYKWMLKKDFFKNNAAPYLILDAMFNKCTRMIFENGFFADIAQKVHSMWLCFHGFNEGTPRVAADMSIEGFNGADLLKMFPDAQYPNMGKNPQGVPTAGYHMAGAFDFLPDNPQGNGGAGFGFQGLPFASGYWYGDNQKFNTDFFYWRYPSENLRKNNLNIWAFLQKFPNVTSTSGLDPRDMQTVIDGAAYNFGNYTQKDDDGVSKSDAAAFVVAHPDRAQAVQNVILNKYTIWKQ